MKYYEEPNCNASYQRFCWDAACWRVFSSFSVFLCCGASYICPTDLHLRCWSIPSSWGDHIPMMSLLWNRLKTSQMLASWGSSGCHPCYYVFFYLFALFFSSAVSGVMWSSCFDAWVFVLCLSLDYDALQHTLTHPQTAAFPIQIAECHTHLHHRAHCLYTACDSLKPQVFTLFCLGGSEVMTMLLV